MSVIDVESILARGPLNDEARINLLRFFGLEWPLMLEPAPRSGVRERYFAYKPCYCGMTGCAGWMGFVLVSNMPDEAFLRRINQIVTYHRNDGWHGDAKEHRVIEAHEALLKSTPP